ncbi:MAG: lipoprotein [Betaproteobacteria bacterium]|nr:lipoprotein [Betaproteobacteria bacterium]
MRTALVLTLVALLLEGCGLKGPLYLPQNPPPRQQPAKPAEAGSQSKPAAAGTIQSK